MAAFGLHLLHSTSSQRIIPESKSSCLNLLTHPFYPLKDAPLGGKKKPSREGQTEAHTSIMKESRRWRHEAPAAEIWIYTSVQRCHFGTRHEYVLASWNDLFGIREGSTGSACHSHKQDKQTAGFPWQRYRRNLIFRLSALGSCEWDFCTCTDMQEERSFVVQPSARYRREQIEFSVWGAPVGKLPTMHWAGGF